MSKDAVLRVVNAAVPGRARLRLEGIRRRPQTAERLRRELEGLAGVRAVTVSPLTGSVLVEWSPGAQTLDGVLVGVAASMARLTVRAAPESEGMPVTDDEWKRLLFALVRRLPAYVKLGWSLARTPAIPIRRKAGLTGGVLYSLAPIDLVPGFIPVWGQLDDIGILLLGIRSALRACPPALAAELLAGAGLEQGQIDRDLRSLGRIARSFGRTLTRGALRQARKLGRRLGAEIRAGAWRVWRGSIGGSERGESGIDE